MTDDGTCKGPFMLAMIKNLMSPVFKMQAWFSTFAFGSGDEKREWWLPALRVDETTKEITNKANEKKLASI